MRYRRALLALVLGAIAVTAALGLYAVIVPDFGELQGKVLGTSASISAVSILVLATAPAWERRLVRPLPLAGALLSIAAASLVIGAIWAGTEQGRYLKAMGTVALLAGWAVLVSLLALATLPRRYLWVYVAAAALTLALAGLGIGAMWAEPDSEALQRLAGGLAVLSAAFVLTVPVLHRASRGELRAAAKAPPGGHCPRCSAPVEPVPEGEAATCPRCGARFRVTYLETG